jgi:hypothetical protein
MVGRLLTMLTQHPDTNLRFLSFRVDFNEHYKKYISFCLCIFFLSLCLFLSLSVSLSVSLSLYFSFSFLSHARTYAFSLFFVAYSLSPLVFILFLSAPTRLQAGPRVRDGAEPLQRPQGSVAPATATAVCPGPASSAYGQPPQLAADTVNVIVVAVSSMWFHNVMHVHVFFKTLGFTKVSLSLSLSLPLQNSTSDSQQRKRTPGFKVDQTNTPIGHLSSQLR